MTTGLLVFVPALLIAAPWLLRNWQLYGDPLGMALVRQTVDLRTAPWSWADTTWLLRGWFVSFWGRFGGAGQIPLPAWLYGLLAVASLASLFGLVRVFSSRTWRAARLPVLLMAAAVGSVALGIWQYSLLALGTDQGRLLFPAVGAIVILWVIGILALFPVRHGGKVAIGLGAFSLALGVYALFGVIAPAYVPPQPVRAEDWQSTAAASPVDFGELALVGWTLDPDPVLYWRADTAPSQDWRTVLRVSAEDGTPVWETRRSPGAGRWSTDRWPAGFVMRDAYRVQWPDWAGSGRYRVDVGVQPFGKDLVLPAADGQPAADQEHSMVLLGWLER